jgi:hypothetical protein
MQYETLSRQGQVVNLRIDERPQIPPAKKLQANFDAPVTIARHGQIIDIG